MGRSVAMAYTSSNWWSKLFCVCHTVHTPRACCAFAKSRAQRQLCNPTVSHAYPHVSNLSLCLYLSLYPSVYSCVYMRARSLRHTLRYGNPVRRMHSARLVDLTLRASLGPEPEDAHERERPERKHPAHSKRPARVPAVGHVHLMDKLSGEKKGEERGEEESPREDEQGLDESCGPFTPRRCCKVSGEVLRPEAAAR